MISERFGPKTWGRWSAWLAVAYAVLLFALSAPAIATIARAQQVFPLVVVVAGVGVTSALLALGAARSLRKQSGGLRLLSGAWGVALGGTFAPFLYAAVYAPLNSKDLIYVAPGPLAFVALASAALGLALTVLHKEK